MEQTVVFWQKNPKQPNFSLAQSEEIYVRNSISEI